MLDFRNVSLTEGEYGITKVIVKKSDTIKMPCERKTRSHEIILEFNQVSCKVMPCRLNEKLESQLDTTKIQDPIVMDPMNNS